MINTDKPIENKEVNRVVRREFVKLIYKAI